jgi:16S rRNA C967 or C1407 C5-methylase (RsmB/RsmF family)
MNLPQDFIDWARAALGDSFEDFVSSLSSAPSVSVRLNGVKSSEIKDELLSSLPVDCAVPWCPDGYYLQSRPSFTLDPLLHAGAYYVQEASSMIVSHLVRQFVT